MTEIRLAQVVRTDDGWRAWCPHCRRSVGYSRGRAAMVTTARAHNDMTHLVYESDEVFEKRMCELTELGEMTVTSEEAAEIANKIMREQDVDNLEGLEQITIGRIRKMLIDAVLRGARLG